VKDQLEQTHCDGSHTTVKFKGSKSSVVGFDKDSAWTKNGENYSGGAPPIGDREQRALDEFALRDKSTMNQHKAKAKVSPWAVEYQFSKFTVGGTALTAFNQKELDEKVSAALKIYRDQSLGTASVSSKRSQSRKSRKSKKVVPETVVVSVKTLDEEMREKLGGTKELEKKGKEWMKFAKHVARKSKLQKSTLNVAMDLCEACDKLRVVKAASLLYTGQANANMFTTNDEPLFLHTFQRAINSDSLSNSLLVEDIKSEDPDRLKLQKLLDLLVKFEADINTLEGREGLSALHLAAKTDNAKLINWLIKNKAEVSTFSNNDENMTPFMMAAKFGNVIALAELLKGGAVLNEKNSNGMTALHFAAQFGQTRAAQFLLRVGGDKKAQTANGLTAGALAQEAYVTTQSCIVFNISLVIVNSIVVLFM
jgi:hypothetical protein